jgi:hypothetical protein
MQIRLFCAILIDLVYCRADIMTHYFMGVMKTHRSHENAEETGPYLDYPGNYRNRNGMVVGSRLVRGSLREIEWDHQGRLYK